jgi:hypothetical protein
MKNLWACRKFTTQSFCHNFLCTAVEIWSVFSTAKVLKPTFTKINIYYWANYDLLLRVMECRVSPKNQIFWSKSTLIKQNSSFAPSNCFEIKNCE